jgi:hypothetical protein
MERMPPGGLEPPHMVPETNALSPELWGHVLASNFALAKLSRKTARILFAYTNVDPILGHAGDFQFHPRK